MERTVSEGGLGSPGAASLGPAKPTDGRSASRAACSLDPVRAAFWTAFRHLFPEHSLAAQTPNGSLLISWSVADDPHAHYPYAAPVMLRFDPALVDAMQGADAAQRESIARQHEPILREGLRGYDPFARFPKARVVVFG